VVKYSFAKNRKLNYVTGPLHVWRHEPSASQCVHFVTFRLNTHANCEIFSGYNSTVWSEHTAHITIQNLSSSKCHRPQT
jgi:hypothetical protein